MLNINSKDNSFYKTLKKISANKKFRLGLGQTLLDGAHLIKAFQKYSQPLALIKDESMNSPEVINLIQNNEKIKCLSLSHDLFLKLSELKTSSGILGLVEIPKNILVASPLTLRASQGFQFGLSYLTEQDLSVWIDDFDGEVFAFTMGGQSIYNTSLNKNIAILIGSEGSGIDAPLLEKTDGILSLPMQSDVESVNAAVAASVFMYEFYRQNEGK